MPAMTLWSTSAAVCLLATTSAMGALASRGSDAFVNDAADAAGTTAGNQTAQYEANFIPQTSTPSWSSTGSNDPGSYFINAGQIELTTVTNNSRYFVENTWAGDAIRSTGYTVEFRMSVDAITDPSRGPALFRIADGTQMIELEWRPNAIVWNGTALALDPSGFHTYRVAYDPTASAYSIWINDALVSASLSGSSTTADHLLFGDTSNSRYGGTTTWDYIRWDTTGAYAPAVDNDPTPAVPEPTSAALMSLSAILLFACRFHRPQMQSHQ